MNKRRSGFTLIEMSIVLFIISILIIIVIPNLAKQRQNANRIHQKAMINVIQTQADLYENETGTTATSIQELYQKHYLTIAQVKSAQHNKIIVNHGRVAKK